jgi:hypothetical protein
MTSYLNTHPSEAWIGLINPSRTLVTGTGTGSQFANDTAFALEWRWHDQPTQPIFPYPSLNGNSTHLWSAWGEMLAVEPAAAKGLMILCTGTLQGGRRNLVADACSTATAHCCSGPLLFIHHPAAGYTSGWTFPEPNTGTFCGFMANYDAAGKLAGFSGTSRMDMWDRTKFTRSNGTDGLLTWRVL